MKLIKHSSIKTQSLKDKIIHGKNSPIPIAFNKIQSAPKSTTSGINLEVEEEKRENVKDAINNKSKTFQNVPFPVSP